jgi:cytochrome c biogenesis protein CcmG/thiol:disulfide interchange protein DsbE
MKWLPRIAALLAVMGLLYVFGKGLNPNRDPSALPNLLYGHEVPTFDLPGLSDDRVVLQNPPGDFVLINFWASWCVQCDVEHPHLLQLAETPPVENFRMLGILFQDEVAKARRKEARVGKFAPTAVDEDGTLSTDFGVRGVPETFLVNPQGIIFKKFTGPLTYQQVQDAITHEKEHPTEPGAEEHS